jgi:hypothetical protein
MGVLVNHWPTLALVGYCLVGLSIFSAYIRSSYVMLRRWEVVLFVVSGPLVWLVAILKLLQSRRAR